MTGPYGDAEHLRDELARVEQLVRARVATWRRQLDAAGKPAEHWGLVHVSDGEIAAYLQQGFTAPDRQVDTALVASFRAAHDVAAARIRSRGAGTCGSRLSQLVAAFDLRLVDVDLLLLTLLPEVDSRYRLVYGYLQNDASRATPTVELLAEILAPVHPEPALIPSRLAAGAPLRGWLLLRVDDGGEPPGRRRVTADERVLRHLLGDDTAGDGPLRHVRRLPAGDWDGYLARDTRLDQLKALSGWCADQAGQGGAVVLLQGPRGSGRTTTARALATGAGLALLAVDAGVLQAQAGFVERAVRLVHREARLLGAALLWQNIDGLGDGGESGRAVDAVLSAATDVPLTFLAGEQGWEPAGLPVLRVTFPGLDLETRTRLWRRYLPRSAEFAAPEPEFADLAGSLASSFQLTPGQVVGAVAAARAIARGRDPSVGLLAPADLAEGCRLQSGRRLVQLAQRVEPRPGFDIDDLVLAPPSRRQLDELRARIALRARLAEVGSGGETSGAGALLVMFTGSSGTGKTMAAQLLAAERGVDLYKIDLAEVVSKYVGETEKNLRQVFREAEDANAVIFFDEADALFGKRGEVREARDRWANIEVNFLLQKVEQFDGVVVLATNLRQNIDEAFLRRIHAIVEFPFPDAAARLQIWRRTLAARHLAGPPDEELAAVAERFVLPGGSIRNVVVDATVRALAAGTDPPQVSLRHLGAALAREYQKLGKPLTVTEFGSQLYRWVEEDVLCGGPTGA